MKEHIGQKESTNNYKAENSLGYVGKYQFGKLALIDSGYKNSEGEWTGKDGVESKEDWLNNPEAQEGAMDTLLKRNKKSLKDRGLDKYVGTVVNGTLVTEEGALMSAHLIGAKGTIEMLKSGKDVKDANGTSGFDYINSANEELNLIK